MVCKLNCIITDSVWVERTGDGTCCSRHGEGTVLESTNEYNYNSICKKIDIIGVEVSIML